MLEETIEKHGHELAVAFIDMTLPAAMALSYEDCSARSPAAASRADQRRAPDCVGEGDGIVLAKPFNTTTLLVSVRR